MDHDDLTRFHLALQYDGAAFHGWQIQPDVRTVQGDIEAVLERISGAPRTLVGSGRTDTGVHATGQVAAVDLPSSWTPGRLRKALNSLLDDDIWVREIRVVADDFHPRFDATARTYHYRVGTAPEAESPFHRPWCWPLLKNPDLEAMGACTGLLPGAHSFRAFAKAGQEERGHRCVVREARWDPWEQLGVVFTITADRYLHHMVRYLVGTLVEIGLEGRPADDFARLLDDPDTHLTTSPPAPAQGLFLARVEYPEAALLAPSPL